MASHPKTLPRKELDEKVWSQPLHTPAKEYGISDVGLKKISRDVMLPHLAWATGLGWRRGRPFVAYRFLPQSRSSWTSTWRMRFGDRGLKNQIARASARSKGPRRSVQRATIDRQPIGLAR